MESGQFPGIGLVRRAGQHGDCPSAYRQGTQIQQRFRVVAVAAHDTLNSRLWWLGFDGDLRLWWLGFDHEILPAGAGREAT